MKLLLVANGRASEGRTLPLLDGARIFAPQHECTLLGPQAPGDVAAALTSARYDGVIVFGGDGTLNAALPALISSRLPVAVFPAGTVNDFARELGLVPDWSALKAILATAPAPLDLLAVNGVPLAVYGSLGFSAETSKYMRRTRRRYALLRRRFPLLMTPLFTARTLLFTNGYVKRLCLTTEGGSRSLRAPALYVANQSRLNNDVDLRWDRARSPGRFLWWTVRDMRRRELLRMVWRLSRARTLDAIRDDVEVAEADRLTIESEDGAPLSFFGDGEPLAEAARLELTVLPAALLVYRAGGAAR